MYALFTSVVYATIPTTGYDEDIAYKGVMYSGAAYCKYKDLKSWDCGYPCD